MDNKFIRNVVTLLTVIILTSTAQYAQVAKYPALSENIIVLPGDSAKWDYNKTHTLSVVEADKDGYKYWGYYGLSYYGGDPALRKGGLARSNDLIHWEKYPGNPIIPHDCRWPSVILYKNVFYMFYAEYDADNDSRIVLLTSKDGIHFGDKTEVVAREKGTQNQNPFIVLNEKDKYFYLTYYHGKERDEDNNKNIWQIRILKSKTLEHLKDAAPKTLLSEHHTIASPSIVYFHKKYYLLIEALKSEIWSATNKWTTEAYACNTIDGPYKKLSNSPVLFNDDACAFQYLFNNQIYIFYSHCNDIINSNWDLRMVKTSE
jgi:hypothetical protein